MILNRIMSNEKYILSLLDPQDKNVLDFGSGNGNLVRELKAASFNAVGCDVLEWYSLRDGEIVDGLLVGKDLLPSSDHQLPFRSGKFCSIVSNQVVEHLLDLDAMSSELFRVLKPGGKIYLLFPVKEALIEPHTRIPLLQFFKPYSLAFGTLVSLKIFSQNMLRPKHLRVPVFEKVKKTRLYFKEGIHFRTLNEIVENFESFGFTVSIKTDDWFDRCYSKGPIFKLFARFLNPKFFLGCHLILEKDQL